MSKSKNDDAKSWEPSAPEATDKPSEPRSFVTIRKGDRAVRAELGPKIAAAMRRRKPKPG